MQASTSLVHLITNHPEIIREITNFRHSLSTFSISLLLKQCKSVLRHVLCRSNNINQLLAAVYLLSSFVHAGKVRTFPNNCSDWPTACNVVHRTYSDAQLSEWSFHIQNPRKQAWHSSTILGPLWKRYLIKETPDIIAVRCSTTSSEAMCPTLPKILLTARCHHQCHIPWTCLPQAHLGVFQLCFWPAPGYLGGGPQQCHHHLSLRLTAIFQMICVSRYQRVSILDFIAAKDDGSGGGDIIILT